MLWQSVSLVAQPPGARHDSIINPSRGQPWADQPLRPRHQSDSADCTTFKDSTVLPQQPTVLVQWTCFIVRTASSCLAGPRSSVPHCWQWPTWEKYFKHLRPMGSRPGVLHTGGTCAMTTQQPLNASLTCHCHGGSSAAAILRGRHTVPQPQPWQGVPLTELPGWQPAERIT